MRVKSYLGNILDVLAGPMCNGEALLIRTSISRTSFEQSMTSTPSGAKRDVPSSLRNIHRPPLDELVSHDGHAVNVGAGELDG